MPEAFPEIEKVRVLLVEYSGLRAEVTARTTHGFQLLAIGVTAASLLVAFSDKASPVLAFSAAGVIALFFIIAAHFTLRDIYRAAARLKEIELDVNDRAGEDLMTWESLQAPGATGFWSPAKPLPRDMLRNMPIRERTRRGEPLPPVQ